MAQVGADWQVSFSRQSPIQEDVQGALRDEARRVTMPGGRGCHCVRHKPFFWLWIGNLTDLTPLLCLYITEGWVILTWQTRDSRTAPQGPLPRKPTQVKWILNITLACSSSRSAYSHLTSGSSSCCRAVRWCLWISNYSSAPRNSSKHLDMKLGSSRSFHIVFL